MARLKWHAIADDVGARVRQPEDDRLADQRRRHAHHSRRPAEQGATVDELLHRPVGEREQERRDERTEGADVVADVAKERPGEDRPDDQGDRPETSRNAAIDQRTTARAGRRRRSEVREPGARSRGCPAPRGRRMPRRAARRRPVSPGSRSRSRRRGRRRRPDTPGQTEGDRHCGRPRPTDGRITGDPDGSPGAERERGPAGAGARTRPRARAGGGARASAQSRASRSGARRVVAPAAAPQVSLRRRRTKRNARRNCWSVVNAADLHPRHCFRSKAPSSKIYDSPRL